MKRDMIELVDNEIWWVEVYWGGKQKPVLVHCHFDSPDQAEDLTPVMLRAYPRCAWGEYYKSIKKEVDKYDKLTTK